MNIIHWCKVVLLSILLFFVSAGGAQATEKANPVNGLGPFTWGQSFSDVEKKYPVKDVVENISEGIAVCVCSISAADVKDNTFYGLPVDNYLLIFYNGQLVNVNTKLKSAQGAAETGKLHAAYQQLLNDFQESYRMEPKTKEKIGEDGKTHVDTIWETEKENGALFYSFDDKVGQSANLTVSAGGKKHLTFHVTGPVTFGANHFDWGESLEEVKRTYGLTGIETTNHSLTDKNGNKTPLVIVQGSTKPLDPATERFHGFKIGQYKLTFMDDKLMGITLVTEPYAYNVYPKAYDYILKTYSKYYQMAPKITNKPMPDGGNIVEMAWDPNNNMGTGIANLRTVVRNGQKVLYIIFVMMRP